MANWNLSVDLQGQGDDLARALRTCATHARTLASSAREAQDGVRDLGQTSLTSTRHVRSLSRAALAADTNISRLGSSSTSTSGDLAALATQAGNAAQDLRRLADEAENADAQLRAIGDVRITARLDDDTAPGLAAVRTAIAGIQALSPITIDVRFDADAAQAAAALTAAQQAADSTSLTLQALRLHALNAANALDELRNSALAASVGLLTLNGAAATADATLASLSDRSRALRTDMTDLDVVLRTLAASLGALPDDLTAAGSSATASSSGLGAMKLAAIGLVTALLPVAAAAVPIAAALGASGIAIGVLGAAISGQIKSMTEATEAREAYDKAVRENGKASAEAAQAETEYLRVIEEMPPATRETAAALGVIKDEYREWSDALADDTMPVVTKSMGIFGALLPKLTPLVRGTSGELDHLMNVAAGGMQSPGFDQFVSKFTVFATESLAKGTTGLVKFSQAMDSDDMGRDLREFLDYARENAPMVGDTLGNLADTMLHVLVAASEMGVSVLTVVDVFSQLVSAIPTSVLSTMLQLYTGFKLVTLGAAALGAVTGSAAIARLGAYFAVMRAAGVGTTLAATAASMTRMQKAAVGLGILAVAAIGISKLAENARGAPPDVDRLTTSLKNLVTAGKFTGELKKTFGDMDGLVEQVNQLGQATKDQQQYIEDFGSIRIGPLDDLRRSVYGLFNDIDKGEDSLKALSDRFASLDESMAGLVGSGNAKQATSDFQLISDALRKAGKSTQEIKDLFPEYVAAMEALRAEEKLAAQGMGVFGEQALATKAKLDAQKASTEGLRQAIVALNETNRAALGGQIAFDAAIDAATKAAKDNAGALAGVGMELDTNTPKAQAAAAALQDLAAKTDEHAVSAHEAGGTWAASMGIYAKGREEFIATAITMGRTEEQAQHLADTMMGLPSKHTLTMEMRREDAIVGLDAVIAKIEATPGSKSVTVNALTQDAIALLNSVGYKTKTLPDGRVEVTADPDDALGDLAAVKHARDGLSDKSITITTTSVFITKYGTVGHPLGSGGRASREADGGVLDFYADGGIQRGGVRRFAGGSENHVAQIAPGGSWRVWGEPETMGEGYVPFAPSKRPRSRAITEEIVRRLGGDPQGIQWNAQGSVTDWRYDPQSGSLYSPSEAGSAGHKTRKVKVKGKNGKFTTKEIDYFDLGAVEKKIKSASSATRAWNKDLETVADRVGGDVAEALAAMGKDGVALAKKMANGSTKYINEMAAALRNLAATAKASLTDYTRQLDKATKTDSTFAKNLATLAAQGYGDLAAQLAAQGDEAAQQLAAAAVKDKGKASKANKAAKNANKALTGDEIEDLVSIIAAVKTSKTGIHDVAATTGLGEDEIIATASKATAQIKSALGTRATRFLVDLAKAKKGLAYANGGIREGIYSTQAGAVTFAEPSTGGEAFIPLGSNKRAGATNVLNDVAGRFGLGLTDANSSKVVIIREQGPLVGANHFHIDGSQNQRDLAAQIDADNAYQLRRLARGGVGART